MRLVSTSAEQTKKIAGDLAKSVSKMPAGKSIIIALQGNLGAGKTTFTQGFIKKLLPKARVKSPTFLLIKHYPRRGRDIYHIDCYRIKGPADLKFFDIKEIVSNQKNIVLIEWAERIKRILPKRRINIELKHGKGSTRVINMAGLPKS